ncbi:hypothetical protein QN344_04140, partial [Mucilaginibacter sp. 5B2]|nr:hypothetical protein [Mucilaginibacter sp. 5B2]
ERLIKSADVKRCFLASSLDGLFKTASAMLIMAIAGDAVLPILYAQLNEWGGVKTGLYLIFILYAVIFYYAVYGHKIKVWKFLRREKSDSVIIKTNC